MIEKIALPEGANRHHTLYFKSDYDSRQLTRLWREHRAMIVPMMRYKHKQLHNDVIPDGELPSDALVGYALNSCYQIEDEDLTRLEGFTIIRNDIYDLSKRRPITLGMEALKFCKFFDQQLEYMSEIPQWPAPVVTP
jgi:hypothetical protein